MSKKSTGIAILAIVVILLLGWWAMRTNRKSAAPAQTQQTGTSPVAVQPAPAPATTTPPATGGTLASGSANNISYNKALQIYGNGYRLQFSQCHGIPGRLSIRQGVTFMLDNRDNAKHTLVVKSQTFRLAAYGFAIVTAKDVGTYNITCDGGGAAELNVEANNQK